MGGGNAKFPPGPWVAARSYDPSMKGTQSPLRSSVLGYEVQVQLVFPSGEVNMASHIWHTTCAACLRVQCCLHPPTVWKFLLHTVHLQELMALCDSSFILFFVATRSLSVSEACFLAICMFRSFSKRKVRPHVVHTKVSSAVPALFLAFLLFSVAV